MTPANFAAGFLKSKYWSERLQNKLGGCGAVSFLFTPVITCGCKGRGNEHGKKSSITFSVCVLHPPCLKSAESTEDCNSKRLGTCAGFHLGYRLDPRAYLWHIEQIQLCYRVLQPIQPWIKTEKNNKKTPQVHHFIHKWYTWVSLFHIMTYITLCLFQVLHTTAFFPNPYFPTTLPPCEQKVKAASSFHPL